MRNKTCEECLKKCRELRSFKGIYYCYSCYIKKVYLIREGNINTISLEDALKKTYEVKGYLNGSKKNLSIHAQLCLPSILIGHKIKVVLVEKKKK